MIVVSDSTPLITLMKAARIDLLHDLFGEIVIPEAVYQELTSNSNFSDEAKTIQESAFIRIVRVKDRKTVSVLQRATGLDLGESEAIVYADDNHADILLMDEATGRRVALDMGIEIMGSVGVLVTAFKGGYISISEVEEAFQKIRNAKRHISEQLMSDALEIIHSTRPEKGQCLYGKGLDSHAE